MNTEFTGKGFSPEELLILTEALNKIAEIRNQETPELEKPKEPACLSFLQLAEKHDGYFYRTLKILNDKFIGCTVYEKLSVCFTANRIPNNLANKFVAEIYLTLLAKEINAGNEKDCHYVVYMNTNKHLVVYWSPVKGSDPVRFKTQDNATKSLAYSDEAVTMWNWYFGEEEGK